MLPLAMLFQPLLGYYGTQMPMVYIHKIVSGIILSNSVDGVSIRYYAILAASFAAAGMLLYFFALMVSHLFAFEVESNIIKLSVKKMMTKPLVFLPTAKAVTYVKPLSMERARPHHAGASAAGLCHDYCFAHRAVGVFLPFRLAIRIGKPYPDGHKHIVDGNHEHQKGYEDAGRILRRTC